MDINRAVAKGRFPALLINITTIPLIANVVERYKDSDNCLIASRIVVSGRSSFCLVRSEF